MLMKEGNEYIEWEVNGSLNIRRSFTSKFVNMLFFQSESHEEYVDIEGYEEDESAQATKAVLDTSLAQDLQLTPENSDDEDHRPSTFNTKGKQCYQIFGD